MIPKSNFFKFLKNICIYGNVAKLINDVVRHESNGILLFLAWDHGIYMLCAQATKSMKTMVRLYILSLINIIYFYDKNILKSLQNGRIDTKFGLNNIPL